MKYLKKFIEGVGIASVNGRHKEYRLKNLQHVGEPIEDGDDISVFQQDWFEKLLPNVIKIHSCPNIKKLNFDQSLSDVDVSDEVYELEKNDCTISGDLIQFNYFHNTIDKPHDIVNDGEPDLMEFDIHFVKNETGIKLLVDITYGDTMAYEFSIESPNKINIIHYTGIDSLHDSETHWAFKDESIKDLVKFFNAFNHGIELTEKDLSFLDEHHDSYKHEIENTNHLYTDNSDLIKFGNAQKESLSGKEDILLIINNAKSPQFKYFPKVARYLRVRNIPFRAACSPEEVEMCNNDYNIIGAISTGSDYSMKNPSSKSEFAASEKALEILTCPIIAMCYGFQSMAKFYGQLIIGGDLNCDNYLLSDYDNSHFLFQGIDLSQQKLAFCFHDYPVNIPNGFENIAMLGDIIAGISNPSIERYGILFHPEENEETYTILDNFVSHCDSKIIEVDDFRLQTYESFIKKRLK